MPNDNTVSEANRRIAKNTAYLYVRMLVMTVVGLYSSRIVLDALGAADYGIYNVVGGMIVFFAFFNTTLTSATQRFLNFYLGKNDKEATHRVFCMSMNIYICLSVFIIILGETIGLWFLNTYLNIPADRMWAARWIYQIAILQFIFNTLRIPYNASIIAYERMDFFAYVSLFEAAVKLLIAYLLYITILDRLITYAALYALVSFLLIVIFRQYCLRKLDTTTYRILWDKSLFKDIYHYSSWTVLDAIAIVFSSQGRDVILNIFHGVTLNAAAGVANQVSSHVYAFVSNFQMAFQPQIIQTYAAQKIEDFHSLISRASKFSYLLFLLLLVPLLFTLDKILAIWLVDVPQYTFQFCQLILISQAIDSLNLPLDISVNATGKVRNLKIGISLLRILNLPLMYIVLRLGMVPYSVWYVWIGINVLRLCFTSYMVKKIHNFHLLEFLKDTILPILIVTILSLPIPYLLRRSIQGFWLNLIVVALVSFIITALLVFFVGISKQERGVLVGMIKSKFHSKKSN